MGDYFVVGCPCGYRTKVSASEQEQEIRCGKCNRYIKVPPLQNTVDMTTQSLISASKESLIGKTLTKRYKIESYIAEGAMGWVYRGTDLLLNIPVAIKILKSKYSISDRQEKRFLNEAKITSELLHPGIVTVRNFYRSQKGGYFMVMDFCPGRSLKSTLETQRHLSIEETIEISKQVLSALQVAHSKGVIHRDIKPANIMVEQTESGLKARILDFGIAKVFSDAGGLIQESLTRTGCIIGTTKYMAPEQITKSELGVSTDLYAVGLVMYECLAGDCPFGGTKEKVIRSILYKPPVPLRQVWKKMGYPQKLPWILDMTILKSLAKDPDKRFRTAEEFRKALEFCQKPRKTPGLHEITLFCQAHWVRFAKEFRIGVACFVMLLVLFVAYQYLWKPFSKERSYIRQASQAFEEKRYEEAYQILSKISSSKPHLTQLRISMLNNAFWQSLEKDDFPKARLFLEKFRHETGSAYIYSLLVRFLEEHQALAQIELNLQKREYKKISELLETKKDKELERFSTREERKNWLQLILQNK